MDRLDRTLTGPLDRTLTASELPSLATPTLPSPQVRSTSTTPGRRGSRAPVRGRGLLTAGVAGRRLAVAPHVPPPPLRRHRCRRRAASRGLDEVAARCARHAAPALAPAVAGGGGQGTGVAGAAAAPPRPGYTPRSTALRRRRPVARPGPERRRAPVSAQRPAWLAAPSPPLAPPPCGPLTRSLPLQSDRFIPTRSSMDLDCARYALGDAKEQTPGERSRPGELVSPTKEAYKRRLAENLLAGDEGNARVLSFKAKARTGGKREPRLRCPFVAAARAPRVRRASRPAPPPGACVAGVAQR